MNLLQKLNTVVDRVKKNWGTKLPIFTSETAIVDLLLIVKGGYSSQHKHFQMNNFLYVLSGSLQVNVQVKDQVKENILNSGQRILVKSGYYHEFKALEETICIEVSFVKLSENDIHRLNEGGINIMQQQAPA